MAYIKLDEINKIYNELCENIPNPKKQAWCGICEARTWHFKSHQLCVGWEYWEYGEGKRKLPKRNLTRICATCGFYASNNRKIVAGTKRKIFEADNFECVYCGSSSELTCDHIKPHSYGGRAMFENLLTCCKSCNSRRQNHIQPALIYGRFRAQVGA